VSVSAERPRHVYFLLFLGLVSISVSAILIRWASDAAPGEALAVWRTIFAAGILAPFALVRSRKEMRTFSGREWILTIVAGIFLGLHFEFWIGSLYHTTVASASVLVSLSPIFLAVIGFLLLKERPGKAVVIAIIVATGGTILLGWADMQRELATGPNPVLGNSMALFAALLVSVYLLIGRVVRQRRSWLAYVAPLYAATAVTTITVALLRGTTLLGYDWEIYGLCLAMAIIPQLMGHGILNYAIRFFPAATIGLASLFEPVGASLLAYLLFAEVPTALGVVAMLIILVAVSLAMRAPDSETKSG
jgi:drug/metabolite transporter (DMT)-like permease